MRSEDDVTSERDNPRETRRKKQAESGEEMSDDMSKTTTEKN